MQQRLIWLAIVLGAIFYIFAFAVGEQTATGRTLHLSFIRVNLTDAFNIVVTMALGLGVVNLFYVHGGNVFKRRQGWAMSLMVFVVFFTVLGALVWEDRIEERDKAVQARTEQAIAAYREAAAVEDPVERDEAFRALSPDELALAREYYEYQATFQFRPRTFFLDAFISPLAATVMALLGFYITFAAYRAFRIRSLEATVMMLSASLMVVGSDPVGGWLSVLLHRPFGITGEDQLLTSWFWLPAWADFDNRVLMSGMQRGLWIGISIAIIAASLRMLLGLERGVIEVRSAQE